jgi:glycine oxidase
MKVIIVGAGVAGLSIGWRLQQAGAETVLLDRGQPGAGATWASAGMLAAIAESSHAPDAEAAFAQKSLAMWSQFAADLEEASGHVITYRKDGALLVAADDTEAQELQARAAAADLSFLAAAEAHARVPGLAPSISGALWAPDEAQVDNRVLGRALAAAYLRAGGRLSANEAVVRIETDAKGQVAALTPFTTHRADAVILAAGAWTARVEGLGTAATPPVRPVKGEMIALVPPAGAALPKPLVWGNGVYLVPRHERLLVGATVSDSGYDTALTEVAEDWLATRAAAVMPELAGWAVDEHWAGLRPGSPDGLPIIGQTAVENVFVASGQYRNGILFAPLIAQTVRILVLERRLPPEIVAFDPKRFQN